MKWTHLTGTDYAVTGWSGGTTTQLAIAPAGAVYADRDFLWRISSATVELEESDFTPLPDYNRLIATLEGSIELRHGDGESLRLPPYQVHAFDGATPTHSKGICRDFNVMMRKGSCSGRLTPVTKGGVELTTAREAFEAENSVSLFYCSRGSLRIEAEGESMELSAGEALLLEERSAALSVFGQGRGMFAELWY